MTIPGIVLSDRFREGCLSSKAYDVRPAQHADHGTCDCCEGTVRTVWGAIHKGRKPHAVYYAHWTFGHPEQGAKFLASLGGWGAEESEEDRRSFGLLCQAGDGPAQLSWIDASTLDWSEHEFLGRKLTAEEAVADPAAEDVLRMLKVLVYEDERLRLFVTRGGRDTREAAEWLERAEARLQMGDDAEAVACATISLGFNPTQSEPHFVRGWARGRDKDYAGGVRDLKAFLERAPKAKNAPRARKILKVWEKRGAAPQKKPGSEVG